jgi:hypothetical protein
VVPAGIEPASPWEGFAVQSPLRPVVVPEAKGPISASYPLDDGTITFQPAVGNGRTFMSFIAPISLTVSFTSSVFPL